MLKRIPFHTALFLSLFSLSHITHATLIDRGEGMIYDDVLDITWLQDAAHITNGYGGAVDWVDALEHGGYDDWRLPTVLASAGPDGLGNTLDVTESEISHLLLNTLGNRVDPTSSGPAVKLTNCGPFLHLTYDGCGGEYFDHPWWLDASAEGPYVTYWTFNLWVGEHKPRHDLHSGFVWAVRDGDVDIPIPSLSLLMTTGLAALGLAIRKK